MVSKRQVVQGLLIAVAIAVVVRGEVRLSSQGNRLTQQIQTEARNQLVNRAVNVESWCGGINGSRDYNRGFVHTVTHGQVAYTLTDLPCEDLIRKTLESPKHKGPITEADHPMTFRLLRQTR